MHTHLVAKLTRLHYATPAVTREAGSKICEITFLDFARGEEEEIISFGRHNSGDSSNVMLHVVPKSPHSCFMIGFNEPERVRQLNFSLATTKTRDLYSTIIENDIQ